MDATQHREPTVLVGVDGSEGSQAALAWALDYARRRHARLRVVNAWRYPPVVGYSTVLPTLGDALAEEGREMLDRTLKEVAGGGEVDVPVRTEVHRDGAAWTLLDLGREADLLVVGSRGRGGFSALLLGSVSQQCAVHAPCPVVIVPRTSEQAPPRRIVVGVDGSPVSLTALRWALDEAVLRGVELHPLLAWEFPGYPYYWEDTPGRAELTKQGGEIIDRAMSEVLAGSAAQVPVVPEIPEGAPAPALVKAAVGAELLVVGSRGRGGFAGLLMGSVSQECAHHTPCPLVIVPPPKS